MYTCMLYNLTRQLQLHVYTCMLYDQRGTTTCTTYMSIEKSRLQIVNELLDTSRLVPQLIVHYIHIHIQLYTIISCKTYHKVCVANSINPTI